MKQDGFNLVGHATAPIGLGEDLRMMAAMLDYLGIPYAVSDVAYNRLDPVLPPFRFMTAAHYDISFFFNSAFANGRLRQGFPERFEGQRLTVGY
ncbi:MAG: hypothetical protein JWP36_2105, partial [Paucimonas sp.]|nr:hypothetical protein [Paucimonas sp.]